MPNQEQANHIDDLVCEHKLAVAMRRAGLTTQAAAKLVGLTPSAFSLNLGYSPKGWRERVERALGLEPGALRFEPRKHASREI